MTYPEVERSELKRWLAENGYSGKALEQLRFGIGDRTDGTMIHTVASGSTAALCFVRNIAPDDLKKWLGV